MDYGDPNSIIQCVARKGFFGTKKPTLTKQEFVDQAIGCWWSGIGNHLTLETEKHVDKAELLYDLLYKQFREFVDSHSITSLANIKAPRFNHPLAQGRIDAAIEAFNKWKSEILEEKKEQQRPYQRGVEISLLEEMDDKQRQLDSLKYSINNIQREQDRLASQGRVAEANVHRHEELLQAQRQEFDLIIRIREIKDKMQ